MLQENAAEKLKEVPAEPIPEMPANAPSNAIQVQDLFVLMKFISDISKAGKLSQEEISYIKPYFERIDSFLTIVEKDIKAREQTSVLETESNLLDLNPKKEQENGNV